MSAEAPAPAPACPHGGRKCCCELKKELEEAQARAQQSAAKYAETVERVTKKADLAIESLGRPDSKKFRVRRPVAETDPT